MTPRCGSRTQPGTLELTIVKRDSATQGAAQAGATLAGAEYTVVDANGASHVGTTDETGTVSFSGLPFGTASVTETKAPEGYQLDPTVRSYQVSSQDMPETGVIELSPTGDFDEHVIAFDLDLVKYRDTGAEGSGLQTPRQGVEFEIVSGTTGEGRGQRSPRTRRASPPRAAGGLAPASGPTACSARCPMTAPATRCTRWPPPPPRASSRSQTGPSRPEQMVNGATLHYIADNDFVATRIQVVKTDATSGQAVPLAGFTFQLLDAEGNPLL